MAWADNTYGFRKKITIDPGKVSSDETDFPVLVSVTDTDLADIVNGGNVENSSGYDIVFYDEAGGVQFKHEIERYVNTSGLLVFWVKIDSLSSTNPTIFYIYYGKSGITDNPSSTDTWDSDYVMVHHLNGISATACDDSTSYDNDVHSERGNPLYQQAGKCGFCVDFDGSDDQLVIEDSVSLDIIGAITFSAWIKKEGLHEYHGDVLSKWDSTGGYIIEQIRSANTVQGGVRNPAKLSVSSTVIADDSWYYIANSFDGSSWNRIYVNDSLEDSDSGAGLTANNIALYIGGSVTGANCFNGKIEEIRISATARTQQWLETTYNSQDDPASFMTFGDQQSADVVISKFKNKASQEEALQNKPSQEEVLKNKSSQEERYKREFVQE